MFFGLLATPQAGRDRGFGDRRHHGVALRVRVEAVVAKFVSLAAFCARPKGVNPKRVSASDRSRLR
jgi:hypothetical protein